MRWQIPWVPPCFWVVVVNIHLLSPGLPLPVGFLANMVTTVVAVMMLDSPCGICGHVFRDMSSTDWPSALFCCCHSLEECVNCVLKLTPKQSLIHSEGCSVNKLTCKGCGWYGSISIPFTFHMHFKLLSQFL